MAANEIQHTDTDFPNLQKTGFYGRVLDMVRIGFEYGKIFQVRIKTFHICNNLMAYGKCKIAFKIMLIKPFKIAITLNKTKLQ